MAPTTKFLTAAAIAAAAPIATPAAAQPSSSKTGDEKAAALKKAEDFDMAKAMAVFEKIFPAQPDPAPGRLALARTTAAGMFPNGTYAAIFDDMMSSTVDRILALNLAELAGQDPKGAKANTATLRQQIAKDDPHFEERMRIIRRVVSEELVKMSAVMEPKLREGLARSIARRFDERQLWEINAFLATPNGKAFAGQTMRMWIDPDVMRSMVQSLPQVIELVPGSIARIEEQTAHLPKPKKPNIKETAPPKESAEDETTTS